MGLLAALGATAAGAQLPPAVGIGPNAKAIVGQGFLMTHDSLCLAVTAAHVVGGRSHVSLTLAPSQGEVYLGEVIARDAHQDVALVSLAQRRPSNCGRDFMLAASLAARAKAYLRSADIGGALVSTEVSVADVDPRSDFILLHGDVARGRSGALVDIDGQPAAMVIKVDRELVDMPLSQALRFDRLTAIVRSMLAARPMPGVAAPERATMGANFASRLLGARLLTELPAAYVDAESAAFRLLEPGIEGSWRVRLVPGDKAVIDIRLGGADPALVSEVVLLRGGVVAEELAAQVQILTSVDVMDEFVWRGTIMMTAESQSTTLRLREIPVRYLRLIVHDRGDGNPVHGIARVLVR